MTCSMCDAALPARDRNPTFPFCSERCQLVDLSRWLDGDYRVPSFDPVDPVELAELAEPDDLER